MDGFNLGAWPDINVTTWTIKEYIQDPIQSDGYVSNNHMRKLNVNNIEHY